MSLCAKSTTLLLILIISFFYLVLTMGSKGAVLLGTPLAFGKVISGLIMGSDVFPSEMVFVGDVMLARDVERKLAVNGQDYPFVNVGELFSGRYVFGNFEAVIPKVHQPTPDFNTRFSVKTTNLDSLVKARFTHWSLANNHSYDFGEAGFLETINQLELRNFTTFGDPNNLASSSLTTLFVNDQVINVLALNTVTSSPAEEKLKQTIESAKSKSDYVFVYVHWGDEYQPVHNKNQQRLAHLMIDAGVDLIIGHHPHVVQDIELYKNKLIFYSLGNFIFDQYFSPEVQTGLVLNIRPENRKLHVNLIPVSSIESRIQPHLISGDELSMFLSTLAARSSGLLAEAINSGKLELVF